MILWLEIIAVMLALSWIMYLVMSDNLWQIQYPLGFIAVFTFVNIALLPIDLNHQSMETYFYPPPCDVKLNGLTHYEHEVTIFENDTKTTEMFRLQNWTNIQHYHKSAGGIFGGQDSFISGDCIN